MDSALLPSASPTMSLLILSNSLDSRSTSLAAHLNRRFSTTLPVQLAHLRSGPGSLLRPFVTQELHRNRLQFSAGYASGGGGSGGTDGGAGGGGGDGAADAGDAKPSAVAPGAADASVLDTDVIILEVKGMTCGGCAAKVKRILESQPQVFSAMVNLKAETAFIWPVSEAKVAPNWQKDVGESLAKHLTSCGFSSKLRDQEAIDGVVQ